MTMAKIETTPRLAGSSRAAETQVQKEESTKVQHKLLGWENVGQRVISREDAAVCAVEQNDQACALVVVGGRSTENESLDLVEIFDAKMRKWSSFQGLSIHRCGCSVASIDNGIFVFGGVDDNNGPLSSCETYDMDKQKQKQQHWASIPSMSTSRWFCASVALPLHGDIVVLGGRDHEFKELDSAEAYDTRTKEWHALASMGTPRFGCGAARVDSSKLIAVGGFDGNIWLDTAEIYDYEMNQWTAIKSMPGPLEFCIATPLGDHYVLVSGKGGRKGINNVYLYNALQGTWTEVEAGYNFEGCAVLGALGTQVVGIDQTSNTVIAQSMLSMPVQEEEDLTESTISHCSSTTSRGSLQQGRSPHKKEKASAAVVSNDASTPWWISDALAAAAISESSQRISIQPNDFVEIPEQCGDADQISMLAEGQDNISASGLSIPRRSSVSSRSRRRRGRSSVRQMETVDAFGRKVLYTGQVSKANNFPHGDGRLQWLDTSNVYKGTFRHGRLDGYGQIQYSNGDSFEGIFREDVRCGRGMYRVQKNGCTYDGNYENDLPHDPNGTMTWQNGTIYIGAFVQGKRTGKGVQRFSTGVRYQGDFVSGKYHGFGLCEFSDGSIYRGQWVRGKAHGEGRLTKANGDVIHDGLWECDGPVFEETY